MIKHIVLLKFKAGVTDNSINELGKAMAGLPGKIPEIKEYQFGRAIVSSKRSYDFALVSTFDDLAAMKRYEVHPVHPPVIAKVMELSESIVAVDFEL